jgi:hypothetical protein
VLNLHHFVHFLQDQNSAAQVAKRKPWEKPKKKKSGKAGKKAQPKPKPLKKVPVVTPAIANKSTDATTSVDEVINLHIDALLDTNCVFRCLMA